MTLFMRLKRAGLRRNHGHCLPDDRYLKKLSNAISELAETLISSQCGRIIAIIVSGILDLDPCGCQLPTLVDGFPRLPNSSAIRTPYLILTSM